MWIIINGHFCWGSFTGKSSMKLQISEAFLSLKYTATG
jgi:hypothetical protein